MGLFLFFEIDDRNIKIMEVSKKSGILSILKCMTLYIPSGIKDGKITDVNLVSEIVKEKLAKNNIKTKKAACVINSSSVITRKIKLPLLSKKSEILSMIRIELEQVVSVDLSQYKIIYKVIANEDDVKDIFYVIYCLPEDMLNSCKALVEMLKLKLVFIDVSFNCFNKIIKYEININNEFLNNKDIYAFVNINVNSISFCILSKGINDFSRISFYNEEGYNQIAAEAHSAYIGDISHDASFFMNKILDEISKYIRYYYSINSSNIKKLYIYGEYSSLKNVIEFLSLHLKIDVEAINHISGIQLESKNVQKNFKHGDYFILILSLFNDKKDISFSSRNNLDNLYDIKYNTAAVLLVFFLITLSFIVWNFSNVLLENKIYDMNLYINEEDNMKQNADVENLKINIVLLEDYLDKSIKLKDLINYDDYVNSIILGEIFHAIPQNTIVTSFSVDINNAQLTCISDSMEESTLFLHNLRQIDFMKDIYLSSIVRQEEDDNYSYLITCKLQDVRYNDN